MLRSHGVKDLLSVEVGSKVTLAGWVHRRRDHGPLIFIDLRNRLDLVQVVIREKDFSDVEQIRLREAIRPETVVQIKGTVQPRKRGNENPNILTGKIEVAAEEVNILSSAETPPFVLDDETQVVGEDIRMKYRYLDLRRERMQKNIRLRHDVTQFMRHYLTSRDFIEVETPLLGKSTPEGARDYLVPARLQAGKFYALPQSPQQYKQLLMVAGLERYFQIARCFRDEDTRGDRQPEFTQLDMEMSFVEQEDVLRLVEEMFVNIVQTIVPQKHITAIPFFRLSYSEATAKYGTDKPDLRVNKDDPDELAFAFVLDFPMFEKKDDGTLGAVHHPFTHPRVASVEELKSADPMSVIADQYDFVLNGYEIGGGSIRTHDPKMLQAVFEILGHSPEDVQAQFGHLLEAFRYGVPPHGGIAPGIDRFVMILASEPNIREVIAFPKTGDGRDLMMNAPSSISDQQFKELHLKIIP